MKQKKIFYYALLPIISIALVTSCSKSPVESIPTSIDDEEDEPLEIGDTVIEWKGTSYYKGLPMDIPSTVSGESSIVNVFGHDDNCSLSYQLKVTGEKGYIASADSKDPFFGEEDAKNGDVISLYVYLPADHNIASLQLELHSSSYSAGWNSTSEDVIEGSKTLVDDEQAEKWFRLEQSFDSLYTFGSIRLNFTPIDASKDVKFFVDDIHIMYGAETVKTGYESNEESLYQTYEDYFKVGCCMSSSMLQNTTLRKIAKEQFNSLTAENEGKPEHVLDKAACQALSDKSEVVITMKPFEKIYDFCEANHIAVRHHTFVWYSQTPGWLFTEDYSDNGKQASRELMLKRMDSFMKETFTAINDRWPGLVYAFDVVNEAVGNGGAGYNKNNKWFDTIGEDFVYQAFKCAYQYKEEDQELYYNDYDFDYNTDNCTFALNGFLKDAIEDGYIDGVGIQGHIDVDNIRQDIAAAKLIKEKGLKCQITELDITTNSTSEEGLLKQKKAYKDLISQILKLNETGETEVNAIVVWGIVDNLSWKSSQNPLLFDSNYAKKPAYYGFLEAIEEL